LNAECRRSVRNEIFVATRACRRSGLRIPTGFKSISPELAVRAGIRPGWATSADPGKPSPLIQQRCGGAVMGL